MLEYDLYQETFPSRKDQKKNMRKKEKENIEQIQYESAKHSPNYIYKNVTSGPSYYSLFLKLIHVRDV